MDQRQGKPEGSAALRLLGNSHLALLRLDDFLDHRQAQPGTLPGSFVGSLKVRKPPEEIAALADRNPAALIDDFHAQLLVEHSMPDLDCPVLRTMLDCVGKQIYQRLYSPALVCHDNHRFFHRL